MSDINLVVIGGRLTRDPEVRRLERGDLVSFRLASTRTYKSGDEKREETTFVDVTMWGARGMAFERFHKKGDRALIQGRLKLDNWNGPNGEKRSKVSLVAESWHFAQPPKRDDNY